MNHDFLAQVGGRLVSGDWHFGWIPHNMRTPDQKKAAESALSTMPEFRIVGSTNYATDKVCLFDLWKHPDVVKALGYPFEGTHQLTGSCVGAGGGNALASVAFADCLIRKEPEQIYLPFWLLPYGRSRYYLGDRGPGEGSTGSTFAKAVREDGCLDNNDSTFDLPKPTNTDGLVWGSSVEMKWSDGGAIASKYLTASRKNLVRTTAECKSADAVREAICNWYPVTCASMYAHQPRVEKGVLLGRRSGSWSHQMSIQAWWKHPDLGEIFWLMNQWGKNAHGIDPAGGPPGGVWILKSDVEWICRTGEVYAFSQHDGFPAQTFSWTI